MTQYAALEQPGESVQPPEPAPISVRRAYTEVLVVFGLFFAASIISAAETLNGRASAPSGGWGDFTPAAVQDVTGAAVAALVVILLSARRGITLRLLGGRLPQGADGKTSHGRAIQMAALGLVGLVIGGIITAHVETGHLPQQVHPTAPYLLFSVAGSLGTGVIEEMVALAFVVTTLRQARRPVPEILVVAVLIRCSYHIYYGVGVIGIAVWAAVFVMLFLRFGSVVPLIVLHFLWDAVQFLEGKWIAVGGLGVLVGVALLLTGLICWLVEVSSRRARLKTPPVNPYYQQQHPYPQYLQYPPPGYPQQPQGPGQFPPGSPLPPGT